MKRKIEHQLASWKETKGHLPLIIKGIRQCGKTYSVLDFVRKNYSHYVYINFLEDKRFKSAFNQSFSVDDIIISLSALTNDVSALVAGGSCIVLDEIQECPEARTALKFFHLDGRFDVIGTGSLLGVSGYGKEPSSIPVGYETVLDMYPMDFEEFLWAIGDEVTMDVIREAFMAKHGVGGRAHHEIMKSFRTYIAVGGMPQAVASFVAGETYAQIDFIKQSILALYEEDLNKHDSENRENASIVFKHLPEQLNRKNPIFKMSSINKNARFKNYIGSFNFIRESMIGNICVNTTVPEIAMELYRKSERFKLYMGDTGLLVTQMIKMQKSDELYESLIADKLGINQGMLFENIVAQMLRAKGDDLFFHEFTAHDKDSEKEKKFEIDFLLVRKNKICPIEVKSSSYRQHKSLDVFSQKYRLKLPQKIIVYTKDFLIEDGITYLPIYMVPCL